jgi:tetratricopeptide (TPR) repeat protein
MTEAISTAEAVLRGYESRFGNDHPDTLDCRRNLADCYFDAGRITEAIAMHQQTLKQLESKLAIDHPYAVACRASLAADYAAAGRLGEAISLFEATLKTRRSKLGPEHPNALISMNELTGVYLESKRWDDAEKIARECLVLREKTGPEEWWRFETESQLGAALAGKRKFAEAEPYVIGGYEGLRKRETRLPAQGKHELDAAAARIVPFYEAWGKKDKAGDWRNRLGPGR